MPNTFVDLVRKSFFRPREAARYVADLNLTRPVIAQAVLLLAILTVIMQYFLLVVMASTALIPTEVVFNLPIGDILFQAAGAYLTSYIVVLLARAAGITVAFEASIAVFIWFNMLMLVLMGLMLLTFYLLNAASLIIIMFSIVWLPVALTLYWSELLKTQNLFLAFVVPVVAILLASAISVVVAAILGVPLMEITTNV